MRRTVGFSLGMGVVGHLAIKIIHNSSSYSGSDCIGGWGNRGPVIRASGGVFGGAQDNPGPVTSRA